ncbi:DUF4249 domain-containing protein [Mucilaginibacter sp. BT774]|uniref:DUF4249 domain-containing protein n=1 Tax=Mucilaginibacter sp. BT774 TaxID=3062276 RepID=UPI002676AB0E|nr:DUF4249 domain-containing protein [Mucilaginibacter sp. BT774]MDO3626643.1 DUF4249 domain-containing protein [Mucilaginibacter sp. BT774]
MKYLYLYALVLLTIVTVSCKKPYNPKLPSLQSNYLVVEGVINSGQDSTVIRLSRTVALTESIKAIPEQNAQLTIESDQNATYPLQELGNGTYVSYSLNLPVSNKYRLHIRTQSGKEYMSDYESVKNTPAIDSIGFIQQPNGIQLYVNTHDPNNDTRYYRWDYAETWNFHAKYQAGYITNGTELVSRTEAQQIYTCFANHFSNDIVLASSAKLINDVIYQNPLTQVSSTSEKLETKYSILVKQYALTKEEYSFWQNLKKNTEQLGSIFDAQPSEVPGNIHCITDPSEPVLGYVGVTNIQQKRVFISKDQLPQTWTAAYPYQCDLDSMFLHSFTGQNQVASFLIPLGSTQFAIAPFTDRRGTLLGYLATGAQCADCTIRGTTTIPSFWK